MIGLERLFNKIIGADLGGVDGGFYIAVAADHNHGKVLMFRFNNFQQFHAVKLAALKPDVQDHKRRPALGDSLERLGAVPGEPGFIPLVAEDSGDKLADIGFVIDDENVTCHKEMPPMKKSERQGRQRDFRIWTRCRRQVEPHRQEAGSDGPWPRLWNGFQGSVSHDGLP